MHCVPAYTWEKANQRLGKTADAMEITRHMDSFAMRAVGIKNINTKPGWIHGRSPLKGILSEHTEQALMSRCVLNILYWDNYKSVRVLFARFLFLLGAKCQVSSVMMPASLLLQLTLFTRLKFKNRLDIIYRTHLHQKFFSNNCVDMDSIPWEKAWLTVREKPLTLWKKQSTWISCHPDGDLKNIALRAGLASPNQLRHGSA